MTDELRSKIDQAEKDAGRLGIPRMVVWSKSGSYQIFPIRDKLPEGFEIVYRTDHVNEPESESEKISMNEYCENLRRRIVGRKAM